MFFGATPLKKFPAPVRTFNGPPCFVCFFPFPSKILANDNMVQ